MMLARRVALVLAVLGITVGAVWAASLWRTAADLEQALTQARSHLEGLEDPRELEGRLGDARSELARAEALSDSLAWRAGAAVPVLSRSVRTVDAIRELATATVDLGVAALPVIEDADRLADASQGVDLAALRAVADGVASLDLDGVRSAHRRLEGLAVGATPQRVREARRETLELGEQVLDQAQTATSAFAVLGELLGLDGPRRHLLGIQNPAELRGTGGLIGQVAELVVDGGRIELVDVRSYTDLLGEPSFPEHLPADEEFRRRYGHVDADTFFGNVNVDPDLPTVAPVALDLYRAHTGVALDGLLLVDPFALELLLGVTGPVELDATQAQGLPSRIGAGEIAEIAMLEAYLVLGGDDPRRQEFLAVLAGRVFESLLLQDPTDPALLEAVGRSVRGGHLQLYLDAEGAGEHLERLGVAGAMPTFDPAAGTDVLAVTANNAGANKQDVHVAHGFAFDVRLGQPRRDDDGTIVARRWVDYRIVVDNPLEPGQFSPYVIGSAPADDQPFAGQTGPEALNRTWFTISEDAARGELLSATDAEGDPVQVAKSAFRDRMTVDHHLEVQGPGRGELRLTTRSRTALVEDAEGLRYEVIVPRQAKGIADEVDLRVAAPPGWRITDASFEAEGSGPRLREPGGALGLSAPPELETEPDHARLRGAVTSDLRLVVHLDR